MIYLLTEMILALAVAVVLGIALGWIIHRATHNSHINRLKQTVVRKNSQLSQAHSDVAMLTDDYDELHRKSQEQIDVMREENRKIPVLNDNLEKSQLLVRQMMQRHEAQLREVNNENQRLIKQQAEPVQSRQTATDRTQLLGEHQKPGQTADNRTRILPGREKPGQSTDDRTRILAEHEKPERVADDRTRILAEHEKPQRVADDRTRILGEHEKPGRVVDDRTRILGEHEKPGRVADDRTRLLGEHEKPDRVTDDRTRILGEHEKPGRVVDDRTRIHGEHAEPEQLATPSTEIPNVHDELEQTATTHADTLNEHEHEHDRTHVDSLEEHAQSLREHADDDGIESSQDTARLHDMEGTIDLSTRNTAEYNDSDLTQEIVLDISPAANSPSADDTQPVGNSSQNERSHTAEAPAGTSVDTGSPHLAANSNADPVTDSNLHAHGSTPAGRNSSGARIPPVDRNSSAERASLVKRNSTAGRNSRIKRNSSSDHRRALKERSTSSINDTGRDGDIAAAGNTRPANGDQTSSRVVEKAAIFAPVESDDDPFDKVIEVEDDFQLEFDDTAADATSEHDRTIMHGHNLPLDGSADAAKLFEPVDQQDDLQQIFGIGPLTEKALNDLGITSYSQLAELKQHDIQRIADALEIGQSRIERDNWVGNARRQLEDVLEQL